ncbi:hypothetical protein DK65_1616 [Brucella pinnipedialis]|nr:hypothetical protein DK65_1616 [Brucella pinnipedialis]ENR13409.1 hypothetical protein C066_01704 [Brucella sp. UK5/01]ENT14643.1 hypothetical protein C067_01731 [Brucella sp. F8/99]ENT21904.1 hypothetical protein C051_01808 [Brucella sp. UK40/99]KFJ48547.1 hypothetical protein DK52_1298 [Brucella abortus]
MCNFIHFYKAGLIAESNHIARPVRSRRDLFIELAAVFGYTRRIEDKLRPATLFGFVGQHIDKRLGDAFAAMVMMDIDVIYLPGAQASDGFRQIIEDDKADQIAVDTGTKCFCCAILKQMLGIKIIRPAWRTAFQCLRIACKQRRK